MAETGLATNGGIQPSSMSASAASAPDWEMLTMSMSSSALGKPREDNLDHDSENFSHQDELSHERSLMDGGLPSDAQMDSLLASIRKDACTDAEAEPFTEGWKPYRSSSSGLYGYVSEHGHKEEPPLCCGAGETYTDSNAAPNVPECLFFSGKNDGDGERRALDYSRSVDEIKFADVIVNKKIRCKEEKHSKWFSTVVWSIAVVAGVSGFFFLGHCVRLAYNQNQQLEIQLSAKDEKLNEMLAQVNRLKEVLGNHHKMPLLRE